jgi:hypothetical protein
VVLIDQRKKIYLRFWVVELIFLLDFLKTSRGRKFILCNPRGLHELCKKLKLKGKTETERDLHRA